MRPRHFLLLPLLLAALCLLPACAMHQDEASALLSDPDTSARQEFMADVQLGLGRTGLAVEGYDKALVSRPADAALRVKKGRALLRLNQLEAALAEFRLALGARPGQQLEAAAQQGAGEAALRLGRAAEAREFFERAVALCPDNWRSRCALGVLLMGAGQAGPAREQFQAALALPQVQPQAGQPQAAQAGREELLNNLGVAQVVSGELDAAVQTFSLALRDARDPERSANNLGLLLVRLGRPAEALVAFRAAGNDARALNNLGYALLLQGDAQKARTLFEKALDLSPRYYETAGENLKQAVQGAVFNRDGARVGVRQDSQGAGATGGVRQGAGAPGLVGQGAIPSVSGGAAGASLASMTPAASTSPGDPAPLAVTRLSLTQPDGPALRFGPASLLGEAAPQHWIY